MFEKHKPKVLDYGEAIQLVTNILPAIRKCASIDSTIRNRIGDLKTGSLHPEYMMIRNALEGLYLATANEIIEALEELGYITIERKHEYHRYVHLNPGRAEDEQT